MASVFVVMEKLENPMEWFAKSRGGDMEWEYDENLSAFHSGSIYVYPKEDRTAFEDISEFDFFGWETDSWIKKADGKELIYGYYDEDNGNAEFIHIKDGRCIREYREYNMEPDTNEGDTPKFADWVEVAEYVDRNLLGEGDSMQTIIKDMKQAEESINELSDISEIEAITDRWYDEDKDDKIVELLSKLPEERLNQNLIASLIAAYNNTDRYDEAIACSEKFKDRCQGKMAGWHYRVAYSYIEKEEYENALEHITSALEDAKAENSSSSLIKELKQMKQKSEAKLAVASNEKTAKAIVKELTKKTGKPCVEFETMELDEDEEDSCRSKLGGVPFLPAGGSWPVSVSTKEKLYFLIQVNFEELPHIENFPEHGILQFFIGGTDQGELYGWNPDQPEVQDFFRVIYYEDISDPMPLEEAKALMPEETENTALPFLDYGIAYGLEFERKDMCVSMGDYRFEAVFQEKCTDSLPEAMKGMSIYDGDMEELYDELSELIYGDGSRIGGYPGFTQSDPRSENDYADYELLLQLDSDDAVMWGDSGIANFFIRTEDLKNCDFSKVMYNWDCC